MEKNLFYSKYKKDKSMVIIYGVGVYGWIAFHTLKKRGINVSYFCDKEEIENYLGIKVIKPEALEQYKNAHILIAAASSFYEIKNFLNIMGCEKQYDIYFLMKNEIKKEFYINGIQYDFIYLEEFYKYSIRNQSLNKNLNLFSIDLVITEKCSLRCKECSNLMQYYLNPKDYPFENTAKTFDNLVENIDNLVDLRIIGGEPFMNKDLGLYIDYYSKNQKIKMITIYTNGTIIPKKNILKSLKNKKVRLKISDYGQVSKNVKEFVELIKANGISYYLDEVEKWKKFNNIVERDYDKEQLKNIFKNCCSKNLLTFLNGRLYYCPCSANGINLGMIKDNCNDYIDFENTRKNYIDFKHEITKFAFELDYLESCNYCGGRYKNSEDIKPAIQIEHPLKYQKIN